MGEVAAPSSGLDVSLAVELGTAIAMVLLTLFYVLLTARIVRANRDMVFAQDRPVIVIDGVVLDGGVPGLRTRNIGRGPALEVCVEVGLLPFESEGETCSAMISLAPGEEVAICQRITRSVDAQQHKRGFCARASYRDLHARKFELVRRDFYWDRFNRRFVEEVGE